MLIVPSFYRTRDRLLEKWTILTAFFPKHYHTVLIYHVIVFFSLSIIYINTPKYSYTIFYDTIHNTYIPMLYMCKYII